MVMEIWRPRWHDRVALLACYKVKDGINFIRFTKSPSLTGEYTMQGEEIRKYPIESNGKIQCYAVPLERLIGEK